MTTALKLITRADADRFHSKIDRSGGPDACWPWTGGHAHGYGVFGLRRRTVRAHRVAFVAAGGVLTEAHPQVLHRCDNPPCCNHRHLFAGTPADNMADRDSKGRGRGGGVLGESNGRAKLTEQGVLEIRRRYFAGESQRAIARNLGVNSSTINRGVRGVTWRSVPSA